MMEEVTVTKTRKCTIHEPKRGDYKNALLSVSHYGKQPLHGLLINLRTMYCSHCQFPFPTLTQALNQAGKVTPICQISQQIVNAAVHATASENLIGPFCCLW